jgi:hypothetical protein
MRRARSLRGVPPARACALIATSLLGAACAGADARDDGFTVRDSAGIRIAESVAPAWEEGEAWSLSPEPTLRIGVADGPDDQVLFRVSAARLLADGGVVVANGMTQVRRYDASGKLMWATGVEGDGPGDFRTISGLYLLPGDSIGVFDTSVVRYTILNSDGQVGRVVTLTGARGGSARPVGMLSDGSVVISLATSSRDPELTRRFRRFDTFVRADLGDAIVDTIDSFPGQESFAAVYGGGSLSTNPPFFLTRQQNTRDGEIALAYTEKFEILLHDASGNVTGVVRRAFEPAPITEAEMGAWKTSRAESFRKQPSPTADAATRRRLVVDEMTFPATHPVLSWNGSMLVSTSGDIWVQHAGAPTAVGTAEASPTWSVFDREGRWLGEVQIPVSFRPMDVGEDQILGVATDELGIEYVQRYELVKPARE